MPLYATVLLLRDLQGFGMYDVLPTQKLRSRCHQKTNIHFNILSKQSLMAKQTAFFLPNSQKNLSEKNIFFFQPNSSTALADATKLTMAT
jgi:hypothetical protein